MKTTIIAGYPGVGKSYFYKNLKKGLVSDSDSSLFDKKHFPKNYIDHIESLIAKRINIVMCSTHIDVRTELNKRNLDYKLVYPARSLKSIYIQRYKDRNSPKAFVNLMDKFWDEWHDDLEKVGNTKNVESFELKKGEYLSDVISKEMLK